MSDWLTALRVRLALRLVHFAACAHAEAVVLLAYHVVQQDIRRKDECALTPPQTEPSR